MPGAILNVFDFLDYMYFFSLLILNFSRLLVSFASLAEIYTLTSQPGTLGPKGARKWDLKYIQVC